MISSVIQIIVVLQLTSKTCNMASLRLINYLILPKSVQLRQKNLNFLRMKQPTLQRFYCYTTADKTDIKKQVNTLRKDLKRYNI